VSDSPHRNAQSFIDTLPADVRDRIGQLTKNPKKRDQFDQPERADEDAAERKVSRATQRTDNVIHADFRQPIYTQPILTPNAALLQVQFAEQDSFHSFSSPRSQKEYETFHAAYVNAGAQPGGRAAALAAQIARDELAQTTLIVPPVLTSVNLSA
jgi:hypothetical protein